MQSRVPTPLGLTAFGEAHRGGFAEVGFRLAARGYNVVSYFTSGKPTLGLLEFTAVHEKATYRFSSAANLATFKAAPEKYVPQLGGFCAFGCFVGKKFDGDPLLWKIIDGKLYFNLNTTIQAKWSEDTDAKIAVANDKWEQIEHTRPEDIK